MKQAPVKSILRVGPTRSLDATAVSMMPSTSPKNEECNLHRGCRRASLKRAVSFSMPSRWQDGSGSINENGGHSFQQKQSTSPTGSGLRMPFRRTDDDDDDDISDDTSYISSCSSSGSADKGLRMPVRRPDKEDEEESASDNPQDNEPTRPEQKPRICYKPKAQLRMPVRQTFSGDKGAAVEFQKRPFAAKRANSFNSLKNPPTGSMTRDIHQREQMQNQSSTAISV